MSFLFFFNFNQSNKDGLCQKTKNDFDQKNSNNSKFMWLSCNDGKRFDSIDELIEHRNSNLSNPIEQQSNNNKDICIRYKQEYDSYVNNCLKSLKDTDKNNFEFLNKFFLNFRNEYEDKKQKIETLSENEKTLKNNLHNQDEKSLAILENDSLIAEIMNYKRKLQMKKSNLEFELMNKLNELNNVSSINHNNKANNIINNNIIDFNYSEDLEESSSKAQKKIEELNFMEQKLIKLIEELEPGLIPSFNSQNFNVCFKCKDNSKRVKKIICGECEVAYCEKTCIKICAGEICQKNNKFVCPKHNNECSLCLRHHYCNSCLKKCYYNNCRNLYCPPCYKKNEHQTRNPTISCKFFTCERDNITDCIMSSLYCQSCEKRICKNCIQNDKDHFPFFIEKTIK